jgi:hypothetical protein
MENSSECQICYESLKNISKKYNCEHFICIDCFDKWSNINKTCPTCRNTELENFDKLYFLNVNEYREIINVVNDVIFDEIEYNNINLITSIIKMYITQINDIHPLENINIKVDLKYFMKSKLFNVLMCKMFNSNITCVFDNEIQYLNAIKLFNNLDINTISIYNKETILLIIKTYQTQIHEIFPNIDENINLHLKDFIKSTLFKKLLYVCLKLNVIHPVIINIENDSETDSD